MRRPRPTLLVAKGWAFYEVQVGKLVLQIRHGGAASITVGGTKFRPSLVNVWVDHFGRWA